MNNQREEWYVYISLNNGVDFVYGPKGSYDAAMLLLQEKVNYLNSAARGDFKKQVFNSYVKGTK